MAEALGIVASSIAIAQIASATAGFVIKLRKLWVEVQNVPATIVDMMEQIDCLEPALLDTELNLCSNNIPAEFWNDVSAKRGASYCHKALHELSDIANDLSDHIQSAKGRGFRKITRQLKVVLKTDKLVALERRLERAMRMLQIAQQGYIMAFIRFQPDITATKVVAQLDQRWKYNVTHSLENGQGSQDLAKFNQLGSLKRRCTIHNKPHYSDSSWSVLVLIGFLMLQSSTREYSAKFRPFWWFSGFIYAWEVTMRKAYIGWNIHLRQYPIRDFRDPVFQAAESGNVRQLQEMFVTGTASPFDRDHRGRNLLQNAAYSRRISSLKFLIQQGTDVHETDFYGHNLASLIVHSTGKDSSIAEQMDFANILINLDVFDGLGSGEIAISCRCPWVPHWEVFKTLQPLVCPNHNSTNISSRLRTLRHSSTTDIRILTFIIGTNWESNSENICNPPVGEFSLIHSVAGHSSQIYTNRKELWHDLAICVIMRTKDMNRLGWSNAAAPLATPLYYAIFQTNILATTRHWRLGSDVQLPPHLKEWLRVLKEAGINLLEYGKRENEILRSMKWNLRRWVWVSKRIYKPVELFAFRIGPEVDDWGVWWNELSDTYAGDFWGMLEERSLHIPGAWV